MKTKTYKILVLSDLKESTETTINSTISLAKMIDAEVEFFHVKKPTEIVKSESQLSAVRNINEQYFVTEKKIKALLSPLIKDHNLQVKYKYIIGNVKDEVEARIKEISPDIIVLGKRNPKVFSFIGDNLTDFVLKKYNGAVMIASKENALEPDKECIFGLFNSFEESDDIALAKLFIDKTNLPLKSFKIGAQKTELNKENELTNTKTVGYVFEDKPNAIETLVAYVSKNNISLLFVDRTPKANKNVNYTNEIISKTGVSLFVI